MRNDVTTTVNRLTVVSSLAPLHPFYKQILRRLIPIFLSFVCGQDGEQAVVSSGARRKR